MKSSLGRISALVGLFMIIASMLLTSILPVGLDRQPTSPPSQPTLDLTAPVVVFPTPDPDGPALEIAQVYIHPAGTFLVIQPQGFTPSATSGSTVNSLSLVDGARYSVIHAYIQEYSTPQDATTLDAANDAAALAASWSEYDGWRETGRRIDADSVTIDFTLDLAGNTYLARHITWTAAEDPRLVCVVRLVAPGNNAPLLDALEALVRPSFHVLPDGLRAPLDWAGIVDPAAGYVIRHPAGWTLADGGPGRVVTTLTSAGGDTLTLSAASGTLEAPADAESWLTENRPGAEALDMQPVTRAYGEGYAIAYRFSDADGATHGGLALLLNTPGGQIISANLRLAGEAVNLLDEDEASAYGDIWRMLNTFAPLPEEALKPATP